jgi:acetyltransferase-like isoleucine patch superfamily enzyme
VAFLEAHPGVRAVLRSILQNAPLTIGASQSRLGVRWRSRLGSTWRCSSIGFGSVVRGTGFRPARSVVMGRWTSVIAEAHVRLGEHVRVGDRVKVSTILSARSPLRRDGAIHIGDGVLIGDDVVIRGGVTIAPGCVITAGSVVTESCLVPSGTYKGSPAQLVSVA